MATRVLGLDVGARRIGIALSDPLGLTAQGLTVLHRRGFSPDLEAVVRVAMQHGAETIVVGLPLTMRGERGTQARRVEAFAEALRQRGGMPVELVDERLTTVQGERSLREMETSRRRRKRLIDQVAAQLILQQYLDTHRNAGE